MPTALLRRAPLLLLVACALVLGAALASQYVGGLRPCTLCLWQRWPYVAAIALAVLALAVRRPLLRATLLALGGTALLVGAGIAMFHVGVEQHWWPGLPSCGGTVDFSGGAVTDLREQLLATPMVRCDQVAWSLLGVSMAGYNLLISLALGVAALAAAAGLARLGSRHGRA